MTPVALIFPGQGAQFVGMGKEFYETSPEAREIFDRAEAIVPDLKAVMFDGPAEKLTATAFCQPGIFTMSMAALAALKADPVFTQFEPRYACGLSLGEYSAICAAGALDFEDALKLVLTRGSLMEEATKQQKGAMAAIIGFGKDELLKICAQTGAEVANFNSPEQIVITGEEAKVNAAADLIEAAGAKRVIPLDVSGAFHSSLMKSAADRFRDRLESVTLTAPTFPVLSNVDAQPVTVTGHILNNLAEQITSSVQWVDSIEAIAANGVTTFLEIGPGNVLKGLIRRINRDLKVVNIQKPSDIEQLAAVAAG
ncbi:MAG: ACP S-malonyltransferase [Candidatus Omnitrophica bacterium]|nr:ACP S-malonyltransferase [Candidatus Omnitrophota bacterium]